jgi:Domain of unknown function (DUF4352)
MRRFVLFGGIVIGGLLLLGASFFLGVFFVKGSGTGSSRGTLGSAAKDKPGVGDTQNVGDLSVTLVEAFRTDGGEEDSRDYGDQMPPNGTFVVARVRVLNGSTEPFKWFEPYTYIFAPYSTDGRMLYGDVTLSRQLDLSAPREDHSLYGTEEIRPGGDVTGTIAFIAELDESVSLELSKIKETTFEPVAVWEFGPVGELPKQEFESQQYPAIAEHFTTDPGRSDLGYAASCIFIQYHKM